MPSTSPNTAPNTTNCIVLVINLKQSTDRRKYMEAALQKVGIQTYRFIEGVDGAALSQAAISAYDWVQQGFAKHKRPYTLGELGCALSHLKCYQALLDSTAEAAFILEDDAILHEDLPKIVASTDRFPKDWTYVQTVHVPNHPCKLHYWTRKRVVSRYFIGVSATVSHCTAGYFISRKKAEQQVNRLPQVHWPADAFWGKRIRNRLGLFNFYQLYPPVVGFLNCVQTTMADRPAEAPPRKSWREKIKQHLVTQIKRFIPPQKPY